LKNAYSCAGLIQVHSRPNCYFAYHYRIVLLAVTMYVQCLLIHHRE
jgi:hypothetical protein